MPAPGEQHLGRVIANPFEEKKLHISEYTAQEVATLQSRLEKQLGPEYISSRSGPGGGKVYYVAAEKCIQLANEVFGFNGWSSQIMDIQVDFVDENPQTLKVSLGLSVIMRVTLRDGTFHEDIGYGHIENCKGKAAAFEKAKKEGTTDGLKRALRNFGNVLGNCIYDKDYLQKVTKIKVQPGKWDVANLHRHSDHIVKQEEKLEEKSQAIGQGLNHSHATESSIDTEDTLVEDDEFGDFDEADFNVPDSDAHPDEVALPPAPVAASRQFTGNARNGSTPNPANTNQKRPPNNNPQPPMGPPNAVQISNNNGPAQPQTPRNGFARANTSTGALMRPPPQESGAVTVLAATGRVLNQPSRALNQPSRMADETLNQPSKPQTVPPQNHSASSAPASPAPFTRPSSGDIDDIPPLKGPGFFSARAAANVPEGSSLEPLPPNAVNLIAFDPHAESPSIPRTRGIDHKVSKPVSRDYLKSSQSTTIGPGAAPGLGPRPSIINPQLDTTRRIGAPIISSPLGNRGSYKPVTIKRPGDGIVYPSNNTTNRPPLNDMPANGIVSQNETGDVKRQRLNG